ncbi:signal transduction histidine kinase/PAS domain-containing protein [Deinococcus metalli]|uniref:histidine kinase n=1 Tax=Deinococcus metalli TaxID=1141878 RepID=A0A7W8KJV5_9DEIO|nr:ATP-binding protein [Deinococcus metalli]MBB5379153.1 signal transduction histidine kinase/PAS domain-containing protein [Deinococcus metalli]
MVTPPRALPDLSLLQELADPIVLIDAAGSLTFINAPAAALLGGGAADLLGRTLSEMLPQAGTALEGTQAPSGPIGVPPFEVGELASGRWWAGRASPHAGGLLVHFWDVTERHTAQRRRDVLLSVTLALGEVTGVDEVVSTALAAGLPAVGAAAGAVLRRTGDGEALELIGARGYPETLLNAWRTVPLSSPLPALDAWREEAPVYLTAHDLSVRSATLLGHTRPTTHALAALPLRAEGALLGILALSFDTERTFDPAERDFMQLLAGQVAQALGRAQTLAARDAALTTLERERTQLSAILDQMPVALWVAELPSGRLIGGNAAIHEALGLDFLPADSIDGYTQYRGLHSDGRPYAAHEWPIARTIQSGETIAGEEIEMHRADGTRVRVRFASAPILNAQGEPELAVVSGMDVTALHDLSVTLEARVAERTAGLDAFVQFTERSAATTTVDQLARAALSVMRATLGNVSVAYYELEGGLWRARVLSEDFAPALAELVRHGLARETPGFDEAARTGDAVFISNWDEAQGIGHTEGYGAGAFYPCAVGSELLGMLAVGTRAGTDFTARERAVIRALGRSLTLALERARTGALIAQQRDELDSRAHALSVANEDLDAFAYSVSHDLRTPLRHIVGFQELLTKTIGTTLAPKPARYLQLIGNAAAQMDTLIDALLNLARTSQHPLRLQAVDLGHLVRTVQEDLAVDTQNRVVSWAVSPLPVVPGDAALLRLVMSNLLGNALKYSRREEQAHIEVWAEERAEMWVVSVRDNGAGFDPQYQDRLFGVFQRLHRPDEFEGTGVGLATVRRIVQRHGGEVWATAAVGQGATFAFTLPKA